MEEQEEAKPAFVSRLLVFGFGTLGDHEQEGPQVVQVDGVHEG